MRLPGRIPSGKRIPELVSAIDVMPTLLDLLEVKAPKIMVGRSLLPLMEGKAPLKRIDRESFCFRAKELYDIFSVRTPNQLMIRQLGKDLKVHSISETGEVQKANIFPQLPKPTKSLLRERLKQRFLVVKEISQQLKNDKSNFKISDDIKARLKALGYLK